ncbi:hypothetical protein OFR22_10625 [Brachyspira hyodysenteriae]|uniref:Uncharacterized protein n=2 Tax=Brachyspira hyodysenteriae TaxID=159 RepID=A0A3B6V9Q5_BRAHW|nr:hypothetical protein [Brachyspira hyodysenteriae]ACN83769.1 hypothetical protein BHWA1_01290 [Brachyspira hyodysenteriae WA1]ANN64112.1 hypothetical protein BHYOB78_09605 [Brachyspira hyodysenteriae ATCC 27164]AUJ49503.1 hypothetical protein BH718_01056 [Brachyspira hyodysenteriae]KLI14379.1 hypothetical protein SU44_11265 [Brachyspira hyodysenteriae]KLI15226.1 hypothetical protein SU46_10140 [Brachyspira hyodysenteriae]
MMKKNIIIFIIFLLISSLAFSQNENEVMKEAFNRFSKSPFTSIYSSGGAFYSGDDLDQMPMLVNYYKNSNNKYMNVVDGLLGSLIFDAKVNNNSLTLDLPEAETPLKRNFDEFALEAPIMRFPKVYADILDYKFIDLSKKIISSNITLGKNWHTLKIGYNDRVDTIVFSASTYRVRSFSTAFMDNVVNVELGSYTTVNNIPYPKEFIMKSKTDKRELRYNVTNVSAGDKAKQDAKKLGW